MLPTPLSHAHHFLSRLSLVDGWLPIVVQLAGAAVVLGALSRQRWRTPRMAVAVLAGVLVSAGAHWYLASVGIAGDPAPVLLWWWLGVAGFACGATALFWTAGPWLQRALSLIAIPLAVLSAALMANIWVGYFPTLHNAWLQFTVAPLPDQVDRMRVTQMQLAGERPDRGVVVPVTISDAASRFAHRPEFVYLPPAWFASNPPPHLPAVMMIGAQLNLPSDWLRVGDAARIIDDFAVAHGGNAPVFVFVDATGSFDNDTECVNGRRGNASLHLTKDVVPYLISNFGTSADRGRWGVVGWSMGGTCAVDLSVRRPELFSAIIDIAGDVGPNSGNRQQTIARLFGGDVSAWADFDPRTVISRHGTYSGVSALFEVPQGATAVAVNPERQDLAADTLCGMASRYGISCTVDARPGRHDWPFATAAFAAGLPWLAGRLSTPGAEAVAPPGSVPAPVPPDPEVLRAAG
ncbi:MAG TPA: alpha/beta hydrolase-fold protein [Mycobacterium sp.]|nr:alpha/beta hydrolase-fold protein [Mycobacterium sp.]